MVARIIYLCLALTLTSQPEEGSKDGSGAKKIFTTFIKSVDANGLPTLRDSSFAKLLNYISNIETYPLDV
jgi:hypothetical protein